MGTRVTWMKATIQQLLAQRATALTVAAVAFTGIVLITLMGGGVIALFQEYPFRYKAAVLFTLIFLPQVFGALLMSARVRP